MEILTIYFQDLVDWTVSPIWFALKQRHAQARSMSWNRNTMEPRYGQCSPAGKGETDSWKLKLVPFVVATDARNKLAPEYSRPL